VSLAFVDTVALIALWNDSDQWHEAAQRTFRELRAGRTEFITTRFVLLECGNAAARTPFRKEVAALQASMSTANQLIAPTDEGWQHAWNAYERGEAGDAGIVDQVSFVVMRRLGIDRAFTNDRHFSAAGFETLF
jgi:uncharacterized protein